MVRVIKSQSSAASEALVGLHDFAEQARAVVLQARQEAARIVAQARLQAEQTHEQATQAGYAEGLARGRADGLAAGSTAGAALQADQADADLAALARSVLAEVAGSAARHDAEAAELLDLALEIARKVVAQVAVSDLSAARANLAKVLELSAASREMLVRVNAGQLAELRSACTQLIDELAIRGKVTLVGDEQIAPGGVKLQTRHGELDATIRRQLDNVIDALLGDGAAGPLFGSGREAEAGRALEAVTSGATAE